MENFKQDKIIHIYDSDKKYIKNFYLNLLVLLYYALTFCCFVFTPTVKSLYGLIGACPAVFNQLVVNYESVVFIMLLLLLILLEYYKRKYIYYSEKHKNLNEDLKLGDTEVERLNNFYTYEYQLLEMQVTSILAGIALIYLSILIFSYYKLFK